jgi:hypothetical protein
VNTVLPHSRVLVPDVAHMESNRSDGRRSWMPKMDFPISMALTHAYGWISVWPISLSIRFR